MATKPKVRLEWQGSTLIGHDGYARIVGEVRTRCAGATYDYVTWCPDKSVSEPYQSAADARHDLESEVRRLLKEAGVEVMP